MLRWDEPGAPPAAVRLSRWKVCGWLRQFAWQRPLDVKSLCNQARTDFDLRVCQLVRRSFSFCLGNAAEHETCRGMVVFVRGYPPLNCRG